MIFNYPHLFFKCCVYLLFSPEEDRTSRKKALLRQHHNLLGDNFIFDGMQLYATTRLQNPTFTTQFPDAEQRYQVTITFIKELEPLDSQYLQILNILLRRFQDYLGMKLLGRNFYYPNREWKQTVQGEE